MGSATPQLPPNDIGGEPHRNAFNAAFEDLGLLWYWDSETWHKLAAKGAEDRALRDYLEAEHPHMLKAYDADFLVDAIRQAKSRRYASANSMLSR